MRVWLIVMLAFLGVVSRYGLQMSPAHALLALHWSGRQPNVYTRTTPLTACACLWDSVGMKL